LVQVSEKLKPESFAPEPDSARGNSGIPSNRILGALQPCEVTIKELVTDDVVRRRHLPTGSVVSEPIAVRIVDRLCPPGWSGSAKPSDARSKPSETVVAEILL
jgi:hypothetical protein